MLDNITCSVENIDQLFETFSYQVFSGCKRIGKLNKEKLFLDVTAFVSTRYFWWYCFGLEVLQQCEFLQKLSVDSLFQKNFWVLLAEATVSNVSFWYV